VVVSKSCVEILILVGEHEKFLIGVREDHFEGSEYTAQHADFGA